MAPISPPESNIIYNRVNVTVAQKIRSIASWNPPRAANGSLNATNPGEETKSDEPESGTALPELTGFGATMREDGVVVERGEMSGNDRLRKQLLGKDHVKKLARGKRARGAGAVGVANQRRPAAPARREEHDWDSGDEGGRSSLGKSKLGARKHRLKEEEGEEEQESGRVDDETEELAAHGSNVRAKEVPKRGSNYLDEVLADRSLRRRKKSRKKDRAMEN
ncbi:hypothetical protein HO173_010711 [Letharia columbiana]|uniref:Uncharacterized protein n=1 Tax=Letharia columbiana TaxID=112416 RepID=A0A8H6FM13_9LECA|nr:uncharacterized protein HO173_010711 [Letharia columbiana]KAF6231011.1 hypothetical protein HO173_010711 [Letharia columbiana]